MCTQYNLTIKLVDGVDCMDIYCITNLEFLVAVLCFGFAILGFLREVSDSGFPMKSAPQHGFHFTIIGYYDSTLNVIAITMLDESI